MKPIPKEDIQSLERDILFQVLDFFEQYHICLLYTSPSPRDTR